MHSTWGARNVLAVALWRLADFVVPGPCMSSAPCRPSSTQQKKLTNPRAKVSVRRRVFALRRTHAHTRALSSSSDVAVTWPLRTRARPSDDRDRDGMLQTRTRRSNYGWFTELRRARRRPAGQPYMRSAGSSDEDYERGLPIDEDRLRAASLVLRMNSST